jgi:hypothetical protein
MLTPIKIVPARGNGMPHAPPRIFGAKKFDVAASIEKVSDKNEPKNRNGDFPRITPPKETGRVFC